MLVVSRERNAFLQEHRDQTHAVAVSPSSLSPAFVKAVARGEMRLANLYREFVRHDEDGQPIGRTRDFSSVVTVLSLQTQDFDAFPLNVAQACGFKTVVGFRGAWVARHPRTPQATVVWLALGDWLDRDRFLAPIGTAGSDEHGYTRSPSNALDQDAPVPDEVAVVYAGQNRQKDDAARAQKSRAMASETPSQRLLRIDRYIEHLRLTVGEDAARQAESAIRQHRRVIEQRVARAEKRK